MFRLIEKGIGARPDRGHKWQIRLQRCLVFVLATALMAGAQSLPANAQVSAAAPVATAASSSLSPIVLARDLKNLAYRAGGYAAWADACSDPAGATVRSDFLSLADLISPDDGASVIQRFEHRYGTVYSQADRMVKSCVDRGKADCCSGGGIATRFDRARLFYEANLKSLIAAASPAESSGSGAESAAAAPASPAPEPATTSDTVQHLDIAVALGQVNDYCTGPRGGNLPPSVCECVANYVVDRSPKTAPLSARSPQLDFKRHYTPGVNACQSSGTSAASPAAAPTSPAVSGAIAAIPAPALEPDKGTMTVDGETRSIVFDTCKMLLRGKNYQVHGQAKDDAGHMVSLKFVPGLLMIGVSRMEPERTAKDYLNREKPALVYQVDGSTVTVDGTFQTLKVPITRRSIQMSFDCSASL